jgi:hypothetical protein
MQLSEVFRQSIVMPKNDAARMLLETGQITEDFVDEFKTISVDAIFQILWAFGIIAEINRACGSIIDEYEEEKVGVELLPKMVDMIDKKYCHPPGPLVAAFCSELRALCLEGIQLKQPIYFVL